MRVRIIQFNNSEDKMELNDMTKILPYLLVALMVLLSSALADSFLRCLSQVPNTTTSDFVFTQNDTEYSSLLHSTIINLRFSTSATPKPLAIITPLTYSHIQSTILCSKHFNIQIRIRSGGHDYAGLSYTSYVIEQIRNLINDCTNSDDFIDHSTILYKGKYMQRLVNVNKRK
ncbi:putative cannabidiolic acid synthase [Helianthus annuus]|nr:putative cannabidiolic acid synthase [Helianthus annuus]